MIERRYCHIKQWRGLVTRYDKHAVTYRAAVLLNATIVWTKILSGTPSVNGIRKLIQFWHLSHPRAAFERTADRDRYEKLLEPGLSRLRGLHIWQ